MQQTPATPRIVVTALALAAALALGLALTACAAFDAGRDATYESPYDWENGLKSENGRLVYSEGGETLSLTGIDVSEHQGSIDWNAVASDGIDFAIIRIGYRGYTEGAVSEDALFAQNIAGARAAGMPVGVYFFSQAVSADEARQEARFVIDTLSGYGVTPDDLAFPVVFDQEPVTGEGRADNLTPDQYTENAQAFCQAVRDAGYRPMIYGNQPDLAQRNLEALAGIPLWYAEYHADVPHADFDFVMWQYDNAGTVAGVATQVDLNLYLTDERTSDSRSF